ncbi:ABC transporter [Rhodococcus sp. 05-2256-B2]|uniref:ATP-binding cassette domain-containing protein n=1 Tax=unclassified Rhodococcus (in: high G+C Gram-positive bacteria) TaxID=192944 RepID=UPI000B9A6B43|nr:MULTISPECIES: ATP-binding cassette domain-containing protein [unclassified Rhodococcus (in: high G+C Gram-positive bacteria)]MBY4380443.1 ABC-F family ATP-binding cassette domain-containing protein [Rhodococcus fascians]MBY4395090.1 ABC-F family ATP-binding cassette domain-containing protein [Rhodococcus fascians]MBY4405169.1 ABC-F family ATP-binding cassette domain-containing protein [Rhodococcus fascians]MBY4419592.1 ABC-F family ATP-binding cassette domain-containing protein [Rhodococcus 
MAHLELNDIVYFLPDGRQLLNGVGFRVGDGAKTALIGPNGTGKTTLTRIVAGDEAPDEGAVSSSGSLGVMRQFVGQLRDDSTVRDLLLSVASPAVRSAAAALDAAENTMIEVDDEKTQMKYAQALSDWGDVGGYDLEPFWDKVTTAALGMPFDRAKWRAASTLSGGEQKRLVLESLFAGTDDLLLLDEPDNYLDVPGKRWLEATIRDSDKSVLFISHDRELIANAANRIVTLEPGVSGATAWVHGGGFATYHAAREDRNARLDELRRRWDEELVKLRALVLRLREKAKFNDGVAARYHASQTRLAKFEEAGPPEAVPLKQHVTVRLRGGRTAKRALVCTALELTGLMRPFDTEIWYGDRVAVLGSNGSGKSHFLRLLANGGTDPEKEHEPVQELALAPVPHTGTAVLGARVRPGLFAQTHTRPDLAGNTLLEILHMGNEHRDGMGREAAGRALDRYGLARAAEQSYDNLSGGQQARVQILLLELSGATLLLLDEPTDNLDLMSADALEDAIAAFEGTVIAVTHDRWFARSFDRFLVFGATGQVYEAAEPVWDEKRVQRAR